MDCLPPPGPQGRFRTTIAVAREPFAATRRWRDYYGRSYMTDVISGRYLVTGDPCVVKDVFRTSPALLDPAGQDALNPLVGPQSLFMLGPAAHSRERKTLTPPFMGERLHNYAKIVVETTERQMSRWALGQELVALEQTRSISAEVIVRAVFGVQDPPRVALYLRQIASWIDAWKPLFILFPFTQRRLLGLSPWSRFVAAGQALDRMLLEDIHGRRASERRGEDILSLLVDTTYSDGAPLSNESIRCHLRTLLFAGHETTMIAMAWVLHYLHADEALLERTLAMIDAPFVTVLNDPWLDAVVNEALRVYPIILGVVRRLREETVLGPFTAPADTLIWTSIAMLHSDPELYPEPESFRPERFLGRTFRPYEFAPFGGGHRRCIGAAFAMLETKAALITLLRRARFKRLGPLKPRASRRNLSMAPAGGVRLRLTEVLPG